MVGFNSPCGITTDLAGNMYVANSGTHTIYQLANITSNPVTILGTFYPQGSSPVLSNPRGIICDSSFMYIANYGANNIYKVPLSSPGSVTTAWTSGIPNPYAMAIDTINNVVYVTSNTTGNIFSVNYSTGSVISANWGYNFNGPCELAINYPYLYVADTTGVYQINIPGFSGGSGAQVISYSNGSNFVGLTVMGDYLYFSNSASTTISVYNISTFLPVSMDWQTGFDEIGYLYNYNNNIYVSDIANGTVTLFGGYGICFLKGTKILCEDGFRTIESLEPGTRIRTLLHGYVPVEKISHSTIYNSGDDSRTKDRLYLCSKSVYPNLFENLVVTGAHSLLVDQLTQQQQAQTIEDLGGLYITENKYRLMAYLDDRAVAYPHEGTFDIYHICLENPDELGNYAIYANGLLVESCCKRHIN